MRQLSVAPPSTPDGLLEGKADETQPFEAAIHSLEILACTLQLRDWPQGSDGHLALQKSWAGVAAWATFFISFLVPHLPKRQSGTLVYLIAHVLKLSFKAGHIPPAHPASIHLCITLMTCVDERGHPFNFSTTTSTCPIFSTCGVYLITPTPYNDAFFEQLQTRTEPGALTALGSYVVAHFPALRRRVRSHVLEPRRASEALGSLWKVVLSLLQNMHSFSPILSRMRIFWHVSSAISLVSQQTCEIMTRIPSPNLLSVLSNTLALMDQVLTLIPRSSYQLQDLFDAILGGALHVLLSPFNPLCGPDSPLLRARQAALVDAGALVSHCVYAHRHMRSTLAKKLTLIPDATLHELKLHPQGSAFLQAYDFCLPKTLPNAPSFQELTTGVCNNLEVRI